MDGFFNPYAEQLCAYLESIIDQLHMASQKHGKNSRWMEAQTYGEKFLSDTTIPIGWKQDIKYNSLMFQKDGWILTLMLSHCVPI